MSEEKKKFVIRGQYPPGTYVSPVTGKRYAITGSGCEEIPHDMPYAEILAGWIDTSYPPGYDKKEKEKVIVEIRKWEVDSKSRKDLKFTVQNDNGSWTCNCEWAMFRRGECEHIRRVHAFIKQEENAKTKV